MGEEFTAFASLTSLPTDLFSDISNKNNWNRNSEEAQELRTAMEANAGLVAGSYKRNELVRIRHDSDSAVKCFQSYPFRFFSDLFY